MPDRRRLYNAAALRRPRRRQAECARQHQLAAQRWHALHPARGQSRQWPER
jgi:hypothetical protein